MAQKKKKRKVATRKTEPAKKAVRKTGRTATGRKQKDYRPYKPRKKYEVPEGGYRDFVKLFSAELKSQGVKINEGRGGALKAASFVWAELQKNKIPYEDIKENIDNIIRQYISGDGRIIRVNLDELVEKVRKRALSIWSKFSKWWESQKKVIKTTEIQEYIKADGRINFIDSIGEVRQIQESEQFNRTIWRELDHVFNRTKEYDYEQVSFEFDDVEIKDNHIEINIIIDNYTFSSDEIPEKPSKEDVKKQKEEKQRQETEKQQAEKDIDRITQMSPDEKEVYMAELRIRELEAQNEAERIKDKKLERFLKLLNLGVSQKDAEKIVFGKIITDTE